MSLTNIIAVVFVMLIVVMTFITEPKLSVNYFKAAGSSIGVVLDKAKDIAGGWINDWNNKAKENEKKKNI